ncbi:hypothetical protein SIAM614_12478 [Stappia aggregata IAM 12614]|uniref:Uncharacterized protein n=1 Tax=Roseibium aggregatum (strain ATCC 25650 / DSM 13394 / JCM 20685 / NBRC 16684 / NCIMB 2208 / IAM 12614 / B1) TaxID=384765 RepID=A0NU33_ROSAI|nr:hypothetical protein SIAM614_12478 [Stappia aggregata IAM 12614] [Roseibium aggregatum IAM 12614]
MVVPVAMIIAMTVAVIVAVTMRMSVGGILGMVVMATVAHRRFPLVGG